MDQHQCGNGEDPRNIAIGDKLPPKAANILCIVLQNVDELPCMANQAKNKIVNNTFLKTQEEAMTEVNRHWRNAPTNNKWNQQ